MLILTRKLNESVIIADNIEVKILEVKGDQVSVGFTAPRKISIYRKEIFEAIQNQNLQAASNSMEMMEKAKSALGPRLSRSTTNLLAKGVM